MKMNLRRIREVQNLKLKDLSAQCSMDVERLRSIEQYREIPTWNELIRILKKTNHYFDEVVFIIWNDIQDHYIPKRRGEYQQIKSSVEIANLYTTTKELERFAVPEDNTMPNRKIYDPALDNTQNYLVESILKGMSEYLSTTDRKE